MKTLHIVCIQCYKQENRLRKAIAKCSICDKNYCEDHEHKIPALEEFLCSACEDERLLCPHIPYDGCRALECDNSGTSLKKRFNDALIDCNKLDEQSYTEPKTKAKTTMESTLNRKIGS